MSKRRKGGKKRSVAHLKKYQFKSKKKRKARSMAKRKKRSTRRRGVRRAPSRAHRRGRRRSGGGSGGGRGIGAVKADSTELFIGGIYGFAEGKAKTDDSFFLNKLPKPIVALGYTGNVAAALYLATMFHPSPYLRKAARVVATIATYKLGRNGGQFTDSKVISGDDDLGGDEQIIDRNMMGALEAEGTQALTGRARSDYSAQEGIPYDDVVEHAGSRV